MPLVSELPNGHTQVNKLDSFCELSENTWPYNGKSFTSLFNEFDTKIRREFPTVKQGAINNVHGDWYEYLISIILNNISHENNFEWVALPLPNISSYDMSMMYVERLRNYITDLRQKLLASGNVSLITSNPDFVIVRKSKLDTAIKHCVASSDDIELLLNLYTELEGKCELDDIRSYFGVKFTVRPDRRLQFAHEGSLQKAMYAHLQTRDWIINPRGVEYFAISSNFTDADRRALRTVATHSIVTVNDIPQSAVDNAFSINSVEDCVDVATTLLSE